MSDLATLGFGQRCYDRRFLHGFCCTSRTHIIVVVFTELCLSAAVADGRLRLVVRTGRVPWVLHGRSHIHTHRLLWDFCDTCAARMRA